MKTAIIIIIGIIAMGLFFLFLAYWLKKKAEQEDEEDIEDVERDVLRLEREEEAREILEKCEVVERKSIIPSVMKFVSFLLVTALILGIGVKVFDDVSQENYGINKTGINTLNGTMAQSSGLFAPIIMITTSIFVIGLILRFFTY